MTRAAHVMVLVAVLAADAVMISGCRSSNEHAKPTGVSSTTLPATSMVDTSGAETIVGYEWPRSKGRFYWGTTAFVWRGPSIGRIDRVTVNGATGVDVGSARIVDRSRSAGLDVPGITPVDTPNLDVGVSPTSIELTRGIEYDIVFPVSCTSRVGRIAAVRLSVSVGSERYVNTLQSGVRCDR